VSAFPYTDDFRRQVADLCATFERLGPGNADTSLKHAAVAIALLETKDGSGEAAFLLTRRAHKLRSHGGQWALPGGRCDKGETVERAALRELHEEVGLSIGPDAVLGALDDYPTRSGYLVTPVVVWVGVRPILAVNHDEVASIYRIPLVHIAEPDAIDFVTIPQSERRVVRVRIGASKVHAPTAAFVYQFRELLAGRTTRVADLEQPVFAWR
jgi:8-oxo-dGTP pyrophosphatase MutT (NUDIX family)